MHADTDGHTHIHALTQSLQTHTNEKVDRLLVLYAKSATKVKAQQMKRSRTGYNHFD